MENTQRHIVKGLQTGNQINTAIASLIVDKSVAMLETALASDFKTILEAKLTEAIAQTLTEHAQTSQKFAQQFLGQTKTKLAGHLVETQQSHQTASIPESMSFEQLESFDVALEAEVARLADEAGTLTIEANLDSPIGF